MENKSMSMSRRNRSWRIKYRIKSISRRSMSRGIHKYSSATGVVLNGISILSSSSCFRRRSWRWMRSQQQKQKEKQ